MSVTKIEQCHFDDGSQLCNSFPNNGYQRKAEHLEITLIRYSHPSGSRLVYFRQNA